MHIDPTTLFLVWFGGGFIIFLAWAALVGQALMGDRPQAVRPAVGVLAVIGVVHPAAAISAIDLVRLGRTLNAPSDDPALAAGSSAHQARAQALALPAGAVAAVYGCAAVSVVVAVAAFITAGGLP